jgi:N-acetylglucosaminyldiphosphoundecaprenol N-acetyl-beta-D-mannosaminyltransferase
MKSKILKMNTDVTSLSAVLDFVTSHPRGHSSYICVSNVHMCMEVFDSSEFASVVNKADMVIPDGRPIFWAQKLLGCKDAAQVRGQDIMNEICSVSGQKKLNIGLYGGSSAELLADVKQKLIKDYPDVRITYTYAPPFRPLTESEDAQVCKDINDSEVDVLFVGIGCPKQERWMFEHRGKVNCVMLGVGAAYDFISGSKRHAPKFMQYLGLEWLFRLISEPKRLWRRYIKQNPRFVFHFFRQKVFGVEFID